MRTIIFFICIALMAIHAKSQTTLGDVYARQLISLDFYYQNTTSNSPACKSGLKNDSYEVPEKWSFFFLNTEITSYKQDIYKFNWEMRSKMVGDLWYFLFRTSGEMESGTKVDKEEPFLSSIYETAFTLTLIPKDKFTLSAGIEHDIWQFSIPAYINSQGTPIKYKATAFTFGPHVRLDYLLADFLGLRLRSAINIPALASSEKKTKGPLLFKINPEIFTKAGFYFGVEYLTSTDVKDFDNMDTPFNMSRFDIIVGWRFK